MSKSLLIVSRKAPWSGPDAREALDIALAGGAFDLNIGMLFLGDGTLQLLDQQQPSLLALKDLQANLKALPMFGVDSLYVCAQSLKQRNMDQQTLILDAQVLEHAAIRALYRQYDQVVTL